MIMVRIYTLSCPTTHEVKYVGRTTYSLKERLDGHLTSIVNEDMYRWLRSLDGNKPIIEEIDAVLLGDADWAEEYWIGQFQSWGFTLLNRQLVFRTAKPRKKSTKMTYLKYRSWNLLEIKKYATIQEISLEKAILELCHIGLKEKSKRTPQIAPKVIEAAKSEPIKPSSEYDEYAGWFENEQDEFEAWMDDHYLDEYDRNGNVIYETPIEWRGNAAEYYYKMNKVKETNVYQEEGIDGYMAAMQEIGLPIGNILAAQLR